MKSVVLKTLFWWPAIFRGILTCLLAAGAVFIAQGGELNSEKISAFTWWDWTMFWTPVGMALVNNLVAFLDQTMGKLRHEASEVT